MSRPKQRRFLYGFIFLLSCGMWTGCPNPDPDPPETPSGIQLTADSNSITVSWDTVFDADKYRVIYRKGSGSATPITEGTTETSLTINGLEANTTYYITVEAGNSGGWSLQSSAKSITTSKIGTPTVKVTGTTANSVTLSWDHISAALRYKIYRGLGTGPASVVATVNATGSATCVWTDTGLSESTSYRYWVSAVVSTGEGELSAYVSATTEKAPLFGAPAEVSATADSSTSITLGWNAVSEASSYEVYRSTSEQGTYTKVTATSIVGTSYTNTGLSSGTTYYYKVRGFRSSSPSGYGDYSSPVFATTKAAGPSAPSSVSASAVSSSSITVTWYSVTGATGYNIYRSSSSSGTYTLAGTSASTSYTDTELTGYTTYYYKVASYNSVSEGEPSSPTSATTQWGGAPAGLSATAGSDNSITLSWGAVSGANYYYIYRSTTEPGTYNQVTYTSGTSYTNTGLSSGITYYYKVRAYSSYYSYGDYSSPVSATTPAVIPSSPSSVSASAVSSSSITITWGSVTGATEYKIYRGSSSGTYTSVGTSASTSYTDTGLTASTTYYYEVTANNSAGEGEPSSTASATTLLEAPAEVSATEDSSSSITLSWGAVSGAYSYYIYRSASEQETYDQVTPTYTTSYTDTGLSSGTTYYYKVRACSSSSEYGDESSPVSATTLVAIPASPSSVSASAGSSSAITVTWGSVTGATEYNIYRDSSSSGTYTLVVGTSASTSYADNGLAASTTYYYKVAATNSAGEGQRSSYTSATTLFGGAPTGLSATAVSSGSITLSWNTMNGASRYYIYRSASEQGTYTQVAYTATDSGITSYSDTGLSSGTTYYYKVRGRDSSSAYGDYSLPVSATTP
ncbi:MAG: fibronectin type III domain-containing protein [Treponema sp.]|nr:fibronectin type III domain-containing protein [Treponema sp.]